MTFPLGPYHPALPEPLSLRLAVRGETVTGVDLHTGYLRRGVEALAAQRALADALDVVERACGTCGMSHRLAACLALEQAAGVTPPERGQALRTVFAEIERAQARLWLLALAGRAMELGALHHAALEAREILFEGVVAATGARLFWGVAIPGGATNVADPAALADAVAQATAPLQVIDRAVGTNTLTRRWGRVGRVTLETAERLGLTGLVLRAAGASDDLRVAAPYDAYAAVTDELNWDAGPLTGDVPARLRVAALDLRASLRAVTALLDDLPAGQERAAFPTVLPDGAANAEVEGPHGRESIALRLTRAPVAAPGWLAEVTLRTPSATNAGLVPIVLQRALLAETPAVLASLDLCVACMDL